MNKFKTLALSGAALAALTVSSVAADLSAPYGEQVTVANPWDAFVSVGAGYTWFDFDDAGFGGFSEPDDFNVEVRGSAAYQFDGGFGVQSDVVFNYQSLDVEGAPSGLDFDAKNVDVAFHAFYRNDAWLIGAFGQYGFTSIDPILPFDFDRYYVGAEAQYFFNQATFYVQGGWQGLDAAAFDEDVDGFFINGELRYFVTDNFKLAVNAGYDTLELDGVDLDTLKIGGTAEYRFDATPVSAFLNVEYRNTEIDVAGSPEISDVRAMAGLKLNLGTQTLIERDRAGASLNPVRTGPLGAVPGFAPTVP